MAAAVQAAHLPALPVVIGLCAWGGRPRTALNLATAVIVLHARATLAHILAGSPAEAAAVAQASGPAAPPAPVPLLLLLLLLPRRWSICQGVLNLNQLCRQAGRQAGGAGKQAGRSDDGSQ